MEKDSREVIDSAKSWAPKLFTGPDKRVVAEIDSNSRNLGREMNKMGKIQIMERHAHPFRADITTAIIDVARETIPAVVHIEVTERQEIANPFWPYEKDPAFGPFFNLPKNSNASWSELEAA